MRITIVGAGIVGLATAHALLDEGHAVTLVDPGGKTGRPTDGNAGWIAHTDIMPLASPKVWRNLPRWLTDPLGPLSIRPGYLPALAPWLLRFVQASSPGRIAASMEAIRSINAEALPAWRALLDSLSLSGHLREKGLLTVWRDRGAFTASAELFDRQRAYGIAVEALGPEDVARLEPALNNVGAAVLYPEMCHVSDPAVLAADLLRLALARGAVHVAAQAVAVTFSDNAVHVRTDGEAADLVADRVVIAAGIWSRPLAEQLGDRIPLDTERGYNATFPAGTFRLERPVMYEGEGFVTSPLDSGDRVGGAVEFAGIEAPPNHRRTEAVVQRLKRFLPHLDDMRPAKRWMGFRPSIPDSLPVIGPASADRRIVYAFGHGHHGLTQAAVTAGMAAALISGRPGPVSPKPFTAQRFSR
ncbi:FAD-binding oxidoreductase [Microvirga sp. 17 mud 1-3]|uniref:NAD(P)/FAD-dependent oxidoreductase n=1 Tax=Microvirga sp. 17 mud 1-3 TaxID=2082949 RepID=UPI000D6D137F|nr:FAD-binding oxidoreductase [Microvirga sp. 17 mud 1-3]AWM88771.1 amino acid oxidase [Microvirga sp. 17 mud 1-3]